MFRKEIIRAAAAVLSAAAVIALSSCGSSASGTTAAAPAASAAAPETAAEAGSGEWYDAVLADSATTEKYGFYTLKDVDGDGVPELFLSTTEKDFIGDEDNACVMAFAGGSPVTLMEIGGNAGEKFYVNDDHVLSFYSRMSGEGHIEAFTLKDGKLDPVTTLDNYGPHHYPEKDNDAEIFLMDGKEVVEEEYNKVWDSFAADSFAVTYGEAITK